MGFLSAMLCVGLGLAIPFFLILWWISRRTASQAPGVGGVYPGVVRAGDQVKVVDLGTYGHCSRLDIVGEGSYQAALIRLDGGRRRREEAVSFEAVVIPEPTNRYDPNAIRVEASGHGTIGYFSRGDAVRYAKMRDLLLGQGAVGFCRGELIGGFEMDDGETAHLGAVLEIPSPRLFDPETRAREEADRAKQWGEEVTGVPMPAGWESAPRRPVQGATPKPVNLIDEYSCQEELTQIDQGRIANGETVVFRALLIPIPDPDVPSEPCQLVVYCEGGGMVGRLSKTTATKYGGLLTDLRDANAIGVCDAWLFLEGGSRFGVKLMLPPPAKAALAPGATAEG